MTFDLLDKTMSMSLPRRTGWRLAWHVLKATIWAYLHRTQTIDIYVGHEEKHHG